MKFHDAWGIANVGDTISVPCTYISYVVEEGHTQTQAENKILKEHGVNPNYVEWEIFRKITFPPIAEVILSAATIEFAREEGMAIRKSIERAFRGTDTRANGVYQFPVVEEEPIKVDDSPDATPDDREANFAQELCQLINKYSMENGSDTPDFILTEYLLGCLRTFNEAVSLRTQWYSPKGSMDTVIGKE